MNSKDILDDSIRKFKGIFKVDFKQTDTSINTYSWFDISTGSNDQTINLPKIDKGNAFLIKNDSDVFRCHKVLIHFNRKQRKILKKWFMAYNRIYNTTVDFIYDNVDHINNKLDWTKIRNQLVKQKKIVAKKLNFDGIQIPPNTLDGAIKLVCAMFQSAVSNFKNGNINKFFIKKRKLKQNIEVIDVAKNSIRGNCIFKRTLGEIKYCELDGVEFKLSDINNKYGSDCKIYHKRNTKEYYLLVPEKLISSKMNDNIQELKNENKSLDKSKNYKKIKHNEKLIKRYENEINSQNRTEKELKQNPNLKANYNKEKFISLDPGLRTFLTGISDNEVVEIGKMKQNNLRLWKYAKKLGKNLTDAKKSKCWKRINGLANDLHWKTINYLTSKYENIMLGDMSTKNIIKNGGKLSDDDKRLAQGLSLFKFRERLKYKCSLRKVNLFIVDEGFTSKMCSFCGNVHESLGGSKIYNCTKCENIIDRDINGAKNILMRCLNG